MSQQKSGNSGNSGNPKGGSSNSGQGQRTDTTGFQTGRVNVKDHSIPKKK